MDTNSVDTLINPVRKSSTFQQDGSHGALNSLFAPKGSLSSYPLQAPIEAELRTGQEAGLSNGVNGLYPVLSSLIRKPSCGRGRK